MTSRILLTILCLLLALPAAAAETSYRSGPKNMRVDIITPDGGPAKGLVLVLHTSGGYQQGDGLYAKKLAAEGYATAIPHFLEAYGITADQRQRTWTEYRAEFFADFGRIATEVSGKLGIDRGRVHAVGFSNGGYWAAYLAGKGTVRTGIAYYAAVTESGYDREIVNLTGAIGDNRGHVLILHGTEDATVRVSAVRRLERKIRDGKVTFVYYEDAGHRFERDSSAANDKAAADAWTRTLAFLARH